MKKRNIILRILIGLPGSGKTYFAKELVKAHSVDKVCVLGEAELQDSQYRIYHQNSGKKYPPMSSDELRRNINLFSSIWMKTLVLDGLFLTTDRVFEAIEYVSEKFTIDKIVLDYWPENKQECLRNDYLRRRIGSSLSIETLSVKVDFNAIREEYPKMSVETHSVYHLPDWTLFFRQYLTLDDESRLYSDSWVVGGETWNCYGDRRSVDCEPTPTVFAELDDLLSKICPGLSYLQYKKILSDCVSVEEIDDSDYYSNITKQRFVCDLESLYTILYESGYIHNSELSETKLTEDELESIRAIAGKGTEEMSALESAAWKLYLSANGRDNQAGEKKE